ncbi:hypothetical protein GZH47_29425 [Paenibacillus rhizovicinus]|uniref:Methyltransferase n=1 Tax=Paenibacillus rhizovicinus TaxID=2704463 RepID=A0A6C0P799_9BACL|nr:hypothetical protein [Paenibacillus rhizovicinus]QHW34510.1 hypothetical protein GZH47_29425 [Paenibacillus rhizovicinus]
MSRSWQRKVQKNQTQINKQRKKHGQAPLMSAKSEKASMDTFKGRSYLMPAFLLLFILFYVIVTTTSDSFKPDDTMFWVTIGLYVVLAGTFTLRRPYLSVGRDFVRSRRFAGDRDVNISNVKGITAQKGYVIIEQHKGGNWVFSRVMNRYPTEQIAVRLKAFAEQHGIPYTEK